MTRGSGTQRPSVLLDVLGRRIRVDAGGHVAAAQVEALWSRCRAGETASPETELSIELSIELSRTDRQLSQETMLSLALQIRDAAEEAARGHLLLLRAAAVATPGGAVLGLVTDSASLRADTVAELSRCGFGYVTTELLALDESFDVTAFPEPLAFEQPEHGGTTLAGPDALGLRPVPDRLHLTAMVVLEHDPARTEDAELTRVPRPDDVRRLEPAVVDSPAAWATTAVPDLVDEVEGVWVLAYRDLDQAAALLAGLVTERTRPVTAPTQLYVSVGVGDQGWPEEGPAHSPVSGHDLALDGLRRAVWLAAAGGATIEGLHMAANRDLGGEHHISVQLVAAAVRDLMALGLLVPEQAGGRTFAHAIGGTSALAR